MTGKGAQISVSMFDVMADWLTVPLLNHEVAASRAGRWAGAALHPPCVRLQRRDRPASSTCMPPQRGAMAALARGKRS
ncbi:hypothetical protein DPM13_14050 [Paracoccus mutanolyticus]|uniref:Uncharacterized protein n=1 Tax=Paracoccus mutanolyticus TaxID=1499308 RepID=A0ABM6WSY8_9RHOB|nr:hypothetical protein [Paracoccus mutanolyticus]AWX93778.1 hypothetical protein DPM13_14050 [Paracoccus mutanolyticus]